MVPAVEVRSAEGHRYSGWGEEKDVLTEALLVSIKSSDSPRDEISSPLCLDVVHVIEIKQYGFLTADSQNRSEALINLLRPDQDQLLNVVWSELIHYSQPAEAGGTAQQPSPCRNDQIFLT
jgi:hypothetical protein